MAQDYPKTYYLPKNLYVVVRDMFFSEISKGIIKIVKEKGSNHLNSHYYLVVNEKNEDIEWWVRYTGIEMIAKSFLPTQSTQQESVS